jgi:hypothetical protein
MSKLIVYHKVFADSFFVTPSTITTGWIPGNLFQLDSTGGFAQLASTDNTMFIAQDSTTELSSPPTGSLLTGLYGNGSKLAIDHTYEVSQGSATRAYSTSGNPESGKTNQALYVNASGQFTTTVTGSVKARIWQVPAASNNYSLGVTLTLPS